MAQHQARAAHARRAHETEWDDVATAVKGADRDAIGTFAGAVLRGSPALDGLIEGGRATYETAGQELVLEIDVPEADIVPKESGWKYVAARKTVEPTPRRDAFVADLYAGRRSRAAPVLPVGQLRR